VPLGIPSKPDIASLGKTERFPPLRLDREKQEVMFRLRKRDWIILTAFIVVGAGGYWFYSNRFEEGLRRTEADMKSNLPLRLDQNTIELTTPIGM
jgi:hypothetical protein